MTKALSVAGGQLAVANPDDPDTAVIPPATDFHLPQTPRTLQSVSLVVLAVFASVLMLQWAKAVLIPVMLAVLASYALSPMVNWMEAKRVPRWLGSAVLLLAIVGAAATAAWSLSDQASRLVESLPMAAQKFRQVVKTRDGTSVSALETVQKAAAQIEQVAHESSSSSNPSSGTSRGAVRVVLEPSRFNVKDYLRSEERRVGKECA